MKLPLDRLLLLAPLLLVPTACGGGGGGDDDGGVAPGATAPSLSVLSPSTSGTTDADQVVVRGTADPGTGTIAGITVNGLAATSSDGFRTWSASVPLVAGLNTFVVRLEEATAGPSDTFLDVAIRRVPPILVSPQSIAVDSASGQVFVADAVRGEVLLLNPVTGATKTFSGPGVGSGPQFLSCLDLELDAANDRLLVIDTLMSAVIAVDLLTSDRQLLVADTSNTTPSLDATVAIALIPGTDRLLALSVSHGLVMVDLESKKLTSVSNNTDHPGPPLTNPRGLAYDPVTDQAYVVQPGTDTVLGIDVESGKRVVVSAQGTSGHLFGSAANCELVPGRGLIVADGARQLVEVSLPGGARTRISGLGLGAGEEFETLRTVAALKDDFLLPDVTADGVWLVDGITGDRQLLGALTLGDGPELRFVRALATDAEGNVLATISDGARQELLRIDPISGDREVVSSDDEGDGAEFSSLKSVDVHPETGEVLLVDSSVRQFVVDAASGNRQVLNFAPSDAPVQMPFATWHPASAVLSLFLDAETGILESYNRISGATEPLAVGLDDVHAGAVDHAGNRLFCAEDERILVVDLETGGVTVVTDEDDSVGGGFDIDTIGDLEYDAVRDVLYYRDEDRVALVAVDVETGERTLVSSELRGTGPSLSLIGGLGLSRDGETLYAYASSMTAVLAVDVDSGDRYVISR